MVFSYKIKNILIGFALVFLACTCFYVGFYALKKSMDINVGFNIQPQIRCELYITPSGGSENMIFSNVEGRQFLADNWNIDIDNSKLNYTGSLAGDLGASFTLKVLNYATGTVFVETQGEGVAYNSVALDAYASGIVDTTNNTMLISTVSNNITLKFYQCYSINSVFYNTQFDMTYAENTLKKCGSNYYLPFDVNLKAKVIPTVDEAGVDVYSLSINGTSKMGYINNGDWYNTLTNILEIPNASINGDISINTSMYWDGTVATEFAGGDGSSGSPFLIATPKQLELFENVCNNYGSVQTFDGYTGTTCAVENGFDYAYYKQERSVYLNDEQFPLDGTAPVANANGINTYNQINDFFGDYNGNFYEINGIKGGNGFIYEVHNKLSKIIIKNSYFESRYYWWHSSIVAETCPNSTLEYCSIENIVVISTRSDAGSAIGGVVGRVYEGATVHDLCSHNCYFEIRNSTDYKHTIASVVGATQATATGLANVNVYNCYSTVSAYYGCVSKSTGNATITNCYYPTGSATSPNSNTTAVPLANMKTLSSFPGFSSSVWQCVPGVNDGYPSLIKNRT